MVKDIKIKDFSYELPDERIARFPLAERDACRLIVSSPGGDVSHHCFSELPALLEPGTLMVCNETRVINARMEFHKATGARIEIFLLEPSSPEDYAVSFASTSRCAWTCLVGNRKKWKGGKISRELDIPGRETPVEVSAEITGEGSGSSVTVEFTWSAPDVTFASIVEAAGQIPIPPYLKRESMESDSKDYQTVFSRVQGSVAAPTAGLHFTDRLLRKLADSGVELRKLTLHVGAGTFQPVKSESIGDHPMHTETFTVSRELVEALLAALREGREILAVGTTSVRTLESLPYLGMLLARGDESMHVPQWLAYEDNDFSTEEALGRLLTEMDHNGSDSLTASTAIMIAPGFRWRIVKRMVTNFHQPQSTLLLLVSSFLNPEGDGCAHAGLQWRKVYEEALRGDYRFLSYGDACLFSPVSSPKNEESIATVTLPPSKSIALRVMALHTVRSLLLDQKRPRPEAYGSCDDIDSFERALAALALSVKNGEAAEVYIGHGAAPLRIFMAIAASIKGADIRLKASDQLAARPHKILVDALLELGAEIESVEGRPGEWHILGRRLQGGEVSIDMSTSSQYATALMIASPMWSRGMEITFACEPVSYPYLEMTAEMMQGAGINVEISHRGVRVAPGVDPAGFLPQIEADWSGASYIYEWALLHPGHKVRMTRLAAPLFSQQGDSKCWEIFAELGVMSASGYDTQGPYVEIEGVQLKQAQNTYIRNCSECPDLVPTLVATLCFSGRPFRLKGVAHLRFKETDRLLYLREELAKLGYEISLGDDWIAWQGERYMAEGTEENPVRLSSHNDHRLAMALSPEMLKGLGMPPAVMEHPEAVSKSFPGFYEVMDKLNRML